MGEQLFRGGKLPCAAHARESLADAVVGRGQHVRPREPEDQQHLHRPGADPAHRSEPLDDLRIRELLQRAGRAGGRARLRLAPPAATGSTGRPWSTASVTPSSASSRCFAITPPGAENPPGAPPAASTRWHGTATRNGLRPSAWPTALDAPGFPSSAAISP